ncbi:MmRce1 family CPBP family CAAX prenyl protease [Methanosarcina sp. T3]|uniref:MmRce1 family CPBP family CAAX prenyl protease n=1 Tax=Methanosarcina sp. T3 TaxID=3439062 RepID=UPI003F83B74E
MILNYKYKPGVYFAATFIATYVLWFAGAYLSFQDDESGLYMLLMLPGLMAPFLISLIMIFTSKNPDLKKDFINRLTNLRLIQPKILPAFFLIMPFSVLASILLSLPFGGSVSQFQLAEAFSFSTGFVPVLFLLMLAAGFEELGWRGYAFDSLQSRYTYFTASLIFSILWSLWHFPLIFVNNSYQYEIFHENILYGVNFFVSIIPLGVIISWICIKNGKSVIAAILFHFIVNISQEILNISQTTKCIETLVLAVVAVAIIALDKELFFSEGYQATGLSK